MCSKQLVLGQGQVNCSPIAKCSPKSQNLRLLRYFLAKNNIFKYIKNKVFEIKTYNKALNLIVTLS